MPHKKTSAPNGGGLPGPRPAGHKPDFAAINQAALPVLQAILSRLFPKGRVQGRRFRIGNLAGAAGQSLSIDLDSGAWKDFATGDAGGDVISLYAAKFGISQEAAAERLQADLGLPSSGAGRRDKQQEAKPIPIVPVPDDAPQPWFTTNADSSVTGWWPYLDGKGRLIGFVVRQESPGQKKRCLPYTFCRHADGQQKWAVRSFPTPRPLFGLELLAKDQMRPVLAMEGEKVACAVRDLLPDIIAITWPGGCGAVGQADWSPLKGRDVIISPDADAPGHRAAATIAEILEDIGAASIATAPPPAGVPEGWDLADAVADGWTADRLNIFLTQARPDTPAPANEPEQDDDQGDRVEDEKPFDALGFDSDSYYFYSKRTHQVSVIRATRLRDRGTLVSLASLDYWKLTYPWRNSFNVDDVANALVEQAHEAGLFDPRRLRGRGAWKDDNHIVLHLGDRLVVDGEALSFDGFEGEYVYPAAPSLGYASAKPLSDADCELFLDLVRMFGWERSVSAELLAGWIAVSLISGILPWRPHIWITGPAGSGKSWLASHVLFPSLGDLALTVQSKSTEAGIRQTLGADARPVVFDEAEGEDHQSRVRLQSVLDLARACSSEDGPDIVKGTSGGHAISHKARACFCFVSILPQAHQLADQSRITVLSLKGLQASNRREAEDTKRLFGEIQDMVRQLITGDFGPRLLARTLQHVPQILENARSLSTAGASHFGSGRKGDQIGTLLAGTLALQGDRVLCEGEALDYLRQFDWDEHVSRDDQPDEERLLQRILGNVIHVGVDGYRYRDESIGNLVRYAAGVDGSPDSMTRKEAQDALKLHGIRVEVDKGCFYIANGGEKLERILSDTPWQRNWYQALQRIPGAGSTDTSIRFGSGVKQRATVLPLSFLEADEDD